MGAGFTAIAVAGFVDVFHYQSTSKQASAHPKLAPKPTLSHLNPIHKREKKRKAKQREAPLLHSLVPMIVNETLYSSWCRTRSPNVCPRFWEQGAQRLLGYAEQFFSLNGRVGEGNFEEKAGSIRHSGLAVAQQWFLLLWKCWWASKP